MSKKQRSDKTEPMTAASSHAAEEGAGQDIAYLESGSGRGDGKTHRNYEQSLGSRGQTGGEV